MLRLPEAHGVAGHADILVLVLLGLLPLLPQSFVILKENKKIVLTYDAEPNPPPPPPLAAPIRAPVPATATVLHPTNPEQI